MEYVERYCWDAGESNLHAFACRVTVSNTDSVCGHDRQTHYHLGLHT